MTSTREPGRRKGVFWLAAGAIAGIAVATGALLVAFGLWNDESVTAAGAPRMIEESATSGLVHVYDGEFDFYVGGGVAVFDCDGDRRPDVYAAGGSGPAGLYRNRSPVGGELEFDIVASPVTDLTRVTGAYPIDVDSDGLVDLAVLRHGENVVLRGTGDCGFETANDLWGLDGGDEWTAAFSAKWDDGQELPTLAFGNYLAPTEDSDGRPVCEDNYLHVPDGEGYGHTRTALSPGWCTLSILFSDWGRRDEADLRLTNDRHYYVDGEEQLWDMSPASPRLFGRDDGWAEMRIWGMGIASQDLTGDGLPEVYLTSQGDNKLQSLVDDSGRPAYEDIALAAGVTAHRPFTGDDSKPSTAWHAEFDDVNNDSLIDLFVTKGNVEAQAEFAADDPNNLLIGQPDGTFGEGATEAGLIDVDRSRGAAVADLNLDGLLDVVVMERREQMRVWRNTGTAGDPGHWIQVDLEQEGANRDAVGAWVEIRSESTSIEREITIGGGHAGGQLGWAHFGMGAAETGEIRVTWPDGETSPWYPVTADQFVIVTRGEPEVEVWDPLRD